jgi:hypothetical protein
MSTIKCLTNYESQDKTLDRSLIDRSLPAVFILCNTCYWCATYLDKTRIPMDNICPQCSTNTNELSSMPIMQNESFIFNQF